MELPLRAKGDVFAPDGRVGELLARISARPGLDQIPVACFYAFDFRTRLLPFLFYDRKMLPAGVRAVAAIFHEAGFKKTRAVFQLWSPNVRPSQCRIDGQPIQVMTTTAMQIHSEPSYELIADAWKMGEHRPLILAGGPKAVYEPDHYFGLGPNGDIHADAAAIGEELILLELLDRVTEHRGSGETMRTAFERCRDSGLLDDIPGLVYMSRERDRDGRTVLINTGVQRLVRNLDELPHVAVGFRLAEPPHKRATLSPQAVSQDEIHRYSSVAALITTHGCRFGCRYCPIPAYNQKTYRTRSPEGMLDDIKVLREQFAIRYFFGTDDNFFNDRKIVEEFYTAMARAQYTWAGKTKKAKRMVRFSTEATEADVYRYRDLVPLAREAGTWAIWFGIEDLSAELINKGQTPEKSMEMFRVLQANSVLAMVMMMYHDGQPARTGGNNLYGLMNQARFLYEKGAASYQCTLHSPSVGAREYEDTFNSGTVVHSADGERMPEAYFDGNHVMASSARNPATTQLNMLMGYAAFYNPMNVFRSLLLRPRNDPLFWKKIAMQGLGIVSLAVTAAKTVPWLLRLNSGRIRYWSGPPSPKFTIRRLDATAQSP